MRVSAGGPPAGVVTFLFTDIEGSTRRWETDADSMRKALAAHDEVLRSAIEGRGGFMFKHTGDGVCAAFASPRSAVDAAVAAQRTLELPVRMGMATGEAELRDGDYFGVVLNRAARVMAAGHGGQILMAESTASLLSGVDLVDLGPRRLRDVPVAVGVFQVRAAELRAEFPPLRAHDTTPGNLRPATASLIGRESEVTELEAAVKAHRLVTLTGVGGVGKTRLAIEVATRLADEFPDGVWFFELAAVSDPAAIPDAVASVLGITQQPGKTVTESVAAALEGRVRLLVIDNCEHVLRAAADLVEAILPHLATVRILATSREGLGLPGEQVWPVRSLDATAGIDCAAVSLFVERAQGIAPGFSVVDGGEAAAVTETCQRLDGIPLAIELAASRMASMTASEMRDRLDHRFRLLVGPRRGVGRHQTLRHAVAWSYDLLDDTEKTLLDRCSVFAGGFDLQSACALAGSADLDEYAILEVLNALVRKSLLVADRSASRTRYSMLETIRQFAEEQLVARGEASEIRVEHSRYFAGREVDIMALWDSPRQREAYDWFTAELANLRTAFRWGADHGDLDVAVAIATWAAWLGFWMHNYEPIAWAEELIEPARTADHPKLAFLYSMASSCWWPGRIEAAVAYSDSGRLAIGSGRHDEVPFGLEGALGAAYLHVGQPEQQVQWCRAMLARGRDTHGITRAFLTVALTVAGCGEDARAVADGLIETAKAAGNPAALSFALYAYGYAFGDADPAAALDAQRRGLAIAQESGNRNTETRIAGSLARLEAEYGDPLAALDYVALAIRNFHDAGNATMIRFPLTVLAAFFERLGRREPAATIAGFGLSPLTATANPGVTTAITNLRDVLGDQTYESLARKGETMTTAAMVTYAYDQIDQARTELEHRS
ncbi:adenylate/guanylate cyclase domain-containing protein [Mycobacterium paraense]|uniref:ATP-binding protein n=1 Tax=Mycobacterium paraense TaxID=767916 RepID=UPI000A15C8BA|nr:adenylate/guanylate cyclase domain-containing protein [Mycobacterium paraense]MCV7442874.1 adenylate/guanylate cyclase domain-containing protein [Mycobacterium paraense]ORW46128.1 cyclase [Mycobacterium paraense]